jgi:hypothetical protein
MAPLPASAGTTSTLTAADIDDPDGWIFAPRRTRRVPFVAPTVPTVLFTAFLADRDES